MNITINATSILYAVGILTQMSRLGVQVTKVTSGSCSVQSKPTRGEICWYIATSLTTFPVSQQSVACTTEVSEIFPKCNCSSMPALCFK